MFKVKGSRFKFQGARLKVQVSRLEVRGWSLEVSGKRLEVKGSRLKVRSMLEVRGYIQDTHNRCIHPHASTYRCLTIPYTTPPAHLGPALRTHMPPSHLCTCACPHMPLKCLPHSVTACTDGHHMASHSAMWHCRASHAWSIAWSMAWSTACRAGQTNAGIAADRSTPCRVLWDIVWHRKAPCGIVGHHAAS